jgi:hypothetical protein
MQKEESRPGHPNPAEPHPEGVHFADTKPNSPASEYPETISVQSVTDAPCTRPAKIREPNFQSTRAQESAQFAPGGRSLPGFHQSSTSCTFALRSPYFLLIVASQPHVGICSIDVTKRKTNSWPKIRLQPDQSRATICCVASSGREWIKSGSGQPSDASSARQTAARHVSCPPGRKRQAEAPHGIPGISGKVRRQNAFLRGINTRLSSSLTATIRKPSSTSCLWRRTSAPKPKWMRRVE